MTALPKTPKLQAAGILRHTPAVSLACALVLALILCAGAAGCGRGEVRAGEGQSGGTVTLSPGQILVVELDSNPSTGFSWSLTVPPQETVLTAEGNRFVAQQAKTLGAPGQELWQFKARAAGKTTFTLSYLRPWETNPPEKVFTLTVDVK